MEQPSPKRFLGSLSVIALAALCSFSLQAAPKSPISYNYLMYSDPLFVRIGDSELELLVTANASRRQDWLMFSVDDNIVDTKRVGGRHARATFTYQKHGHRLRAKCVSLVAVDYTMNHRCSVSTDNRKLGTMDVVKRICGKPSDIDKK